MSDDIDANWEQVLDPAILRLRLIGISLFLAGFDLLKASVVSRIQGFFTSGFNNSDRILDDQYESDVLARNRSPLYASLAWLTDQKAIDNEDLCVFERIKACRNRLAHELPTVILGESYMEHLDVFPDMLHLLQKIEMWWIVNVDIPTNPDFDNKEIDESEINPGPVITLKMMLNIALGSEEDSNAYLKEWRRLRAKP